MWSKVLVRNVFVSNSEIKAEKEQLDHEILTTIVTKLTMLTILTMLGG